MHDGPRHDHEHAHAHQGDCGPSGPQDRGHHGGSGDRGGAPGSEFLDLEISKVIEGEASELTRAAFQELLKEGIKARLRERLGEKIDALARMAADAALDDLEANLAVEAIISARRERREATAGQVRDVLRGAPRSGSEGEGSADASRSKP